MIVSEARIGANRANALKSTGPRSAEGKERSRANALKHGLCSATVAVEAEPGAAEARSDAWRQMLKPRGEAQAWLVGEVAAVSLRIDHLARVERQARDLAALRAELCWDDDRRLAAEALGSRLARGPADVVERLKATPQGCDWLIRRWSLLARAGDLALDWTPAQRSMAFDLLGTPAEFRVGWPGPPAGPDPDPDGPPERPTTIPTDLARREIEALRDRRARAAEIDAVERSLASANLADEPSPELRRLRRYEVALHKRLRWFLDRLQAEPDGTPGPAGRAVEVPRRPDPALIIPDLPCHQGEGEGAITTDSPRVAGGRAVGPPRRDRNDEAPRATPRAGTVAEGPVSGGPSRRDYCGTNPLSAAGPARRDPYGDDPTPAEVTCRRG